MPACGKRQDAEIVEGDRREGGPKIGPLDRESGPPGTENRAPPGEPRSETDGAGRSAVEEVTEESGAGPGRGVRRSAGGPES